MLCDVIKSRRVFDEIYVLLLFVSFSLATEEGDKLQRARYRYIARITLFRDFKEKYIIWLCIDINLTCGKIYVDVTKLHGKKLTKT